MSSFSSSTRLPTALTLVSAPSLPKSRVNLSPAGSGNSSVGKESRVARTRSGKKPTERLWGRKLLQGFLQILALALIIPSCMEAWGRWTGSPWLLSHTLEALGWSPVPSSWIYEPGRGFGQLMGHLGGAFILLTLCYPLRKRMPRPLQIGPLWSWLDIHIFFGVTGFTLITLHTAGKFGGIVALCYYATFITFASGVVGRFLYVQIPRRMSGKERELEELQGELAQLLDEVREELSWLGSSEVFVAPAKSPVNGKTGILRDCWRLWQARRAFRKDRRSLKKKLRSSKLSRARRRQLLQGWSLMAGKARQIQTYQSVKRLLGAWHRFHLPFTILLFAILTLHVSVAWLFYVEN